MKNESSNIILIGNTEAVDLTEVSNSKIKCFTSCGRKGHYKYVEKLRPKRKPKALHFGSVFHETMETLLKGESVKEKILAYKAEWDAMMDEEKELYAEADPKNILNLVKRYKKHWAEHDKDAEIICVEQDFKIRIPDTPLVYVGKIDYIQRRDSGIYPSDLKTCKSIPDDEFRMRDTQSANYLWSLKLLAPYLGFKPDEIRGFVFDYVRKKPPAIPEVLKNGTLSRRKNIDTDVETYRQAVIDNGEDPDDYADMLELLKYRGKKFFARRMITKSDYLLKSVFDEVVSIGMMIHNGTFPNFRNIGLDCDHCEYKSICQCDLLGYDRESVISSDYIDGKKEKVEETEVTDEIELDELLEMEGYNG